MPTYLYKDLQSGEIYEIQQSMRDAALTQHPETGAAIKRIPARPAIAFKGSGFYATDSRPKTGGEGSKPPGKAESSPAPSSASSSGGTSSGGGE